MGRLDFLIVDNSRLWKTARQVIRDLFFYTLLLDELRFKQILGAHSDAVSRSPLRTPPTCLPVVLCRKHAQQAPGLWRCTAVS